MNKIVYRKIFSNITIVVVFSAVVSNLLFKNRVYISFLLVLFSFIDFLISWINYLRIDGFIPGSKKDPKLHGDGVFSLAKGHWFNNRIDRNEQNDEFVHLDITPKAYTKLVMLSYLISGLILLVLSFILYSL